MAIIHEYLLKMVRPPLYGIKLAIMERMCKLADKDGIVKLTAKQVLDPIKSYGPEQKYQFWVELVRKHAMISNVNEADETKNPYFRCKGELVHYRVNFPTLVKIDPKGREKRYRKKLRAAKASFLEIHEIATSDPNLTHKTPEELLAQIEKKSRRAAWASVYENEQTIESIEILKASLEASGQVEGDQEDAGGRTGDAAGVREDEPTGTGPQP